MWTILLLSLINIHRNTEDVLTEKLALHVHIRKVNANVFKVMHNAFLRNFYFSL